LIEIANTLSQDKNCLVFKPTLDSRSSSDVVATHDGKKINAIAVPDGNALREVVFREGKRFLPVAVFIDEFQFFDDSIVSVVKELLEFVDVYISGLEKDYLSEIFGHAHKLKYLASEIVFLRATCTKCNNRADYNCRIVQTTGSQVQVGGKGDYEPRCVNHNVYPINDSGV
jgi:thymidine kinase